MTIPIALTVGSLNFGVAQTVGIVVFLERNKELSMLRAERTPHKAFCGAVRISILP